MVFFMPISLSPSDDNEEVREPENTTKQPPQYDNSNGNSSLDHSDNIHKLKTASLQWKKTLSGPSKNKKTAPTKVDRSSFRKASETQVWVSPHYRGGVLVKGHWKKNGFVSKRYPNPPKLWLGMHSESQKSKMTAEEKATATLVYRLEQRKKLAQSRGVQEDSLPL